MMTETLAERIKSHRERIGYNKARLSREVGVSDVTIHYWEIGQFNSIRHIHLQRIAVLFGITVSELIGDPLFTQRQADLLNHHAEALQKMADDVPYGIDCGEEASALERAADYLREEAQKLQGTPSEPSETSIN